MKEKHRLDDQRPLQRRLPSLQVCCQDEIVVRNVLRVYIQMPCKLEIAFDVDSFPSKLSTLKIAVVRFF